MPARGLSLGRSGEDAAAAWLQGRGYAILARNWRAGRLELDMVCRKDGVVVFVEVKSRGAGSLGTPADGLTPRKKNALLRAAQLYLSRHDLWTHPCRFDLLEVRAEGGGLRLDLLEDVLAAEGWQPW